MAEIGKSLVFYNQYFAEMSRLYDEGRSFAEIDKRRDSDQIRKEIDTVGHIAGKEARILLEACIADLKVRLEGSGVARLERARKPATDEKHWEVGFNVLSRHQRKVRNDTRQIGVTITFDGLTPWVWSRGGLAAVERLRHLLGASVPNLNARKLGWSSGTLLLRTISIPWSSAKDFVLEADSFIEQTRKVFEVITPDRTKKLLTMP